MSVAAVGAAVVGGAMSMSASSKASKAQQAGADAAIASQEYMFDETNKLNAPFREQGLNALNQLSYGLGTINGGNTAGTAYVVDKNGVPTANKQLYQTSPEYRKAWDEYAQLHQSQYGTDYTTGSFFDPIDSYIKARVPEGTDTQSGYGALTRKFAQGDLDKDLVYQNGLQFGLNEGEKGLNRIAAASGNFLSGAAAKALSRFGNDYATTKTGDAYNRYTSEQNNQFNKLAAQAGIGQVATNQITSAGQNMANNVSATQIGLGNARGASAIAQGNALSNGLSSAYNGYQQSQLMNKLFPTSYGVAQQPGVTDWVSQG